MPATPDHPTLLLADKLVEVIADEWEPESPSGVERIYDLPFLVEDLKAAGGRKVWLIPVSYTNDEIVSRAKMKWMHGFELYVVEKYDETVSGLPSVAWADERVKFVLDLKGWLNFPDSNAGPGAVGLKFGSPGRNVFTDRYEGPQGPIPIYDPVMLSDFSVFWADFKVFFWELL